MAETQKRTRKLEEPVIANGDAAPAKRRSHPNSLAAIEPYRVKPGQVLNPKGRPKDTPLVSPALRRMAQMSWSEFRKLDPAKLSVAEALAWRTIMDGLDEEGFKAGTVSREQIMNRLDGPVERDKADVNVNVGVGVALSWSDGSPA